MNTGTSKERTVAGITAFILLASVVSSVYFMGTNSTIKVRLNDERLKNELLLSEKLSLNKELYQTVDRIHVINDNRMESEELLAQANLKLTEKERELERIKMENAKVKDLREQLAGVREVHDDFMHQITVLQMQNETLENENFEQQESMMLWQLERDDYMKQIKAASANSMIKADNHMVDAFKYTTKEKSTVKAKRTKKLVFIIDVPQNIASDIGFNLTTPNGKVITNKSKNLSWKVVNNDDSLLASINQFDNEVIASNEVKLTYTPIIKMKPGVYKIGILHKGKNIGNCRVRLE